MFTYSLPWRSGTIAPTRGGIRGLLMSAFKSFLCFLLSFEKHGVKRTTSMLPTASQDNTFCGCCEHAYLKDKPWTKKKLEAWSACSVHPNEDFINDASMIRLPTRTSKLGKDQMHNHWVPISQNGSCKEQIFVLSHKEWDFNNASLDHLEWGFYGSWSRDLAKRLPPCTRCRTPSDHCPLW